MSPNDPLGIQLANYIAARDTEAAKSMAHRMPPSQVGGVLEAMAANDRLPVRLLVLELAREIPSVGATRALISRLSDRDLTVRSVAGSSIGHARDKSAVPDLLQALDQDLPGPVKGAIARRIGVLGGDTDIPSLRKFYAKSTDGTYRRDLSVALAKLGDSSHRSQLIQRLSHTDPGTRVQALREVEYLGDRTLITNFDGPLLDSRNVLDISPPHVAPVVWARVCDVAIQSMANLGVHLSFDGFTLRRFTQPQVAEARQSVNLTRRNG